MENSQAKLRTRVFELAEARGIRPGELAVAMNIDPSYLWRVKVGQRGISQAFITGAKRAFPELSLDELFYTENDTPDSTDAA